MELFYAIDVSREFLKRVQQAAWTIRKYPCHAYHFAKHEIL